MVIVEVTAVLHRLQFALDMGFINAILESDSKLVIQNIQQMKGNAATHAVAVEGLRTQVDSFWVEDASTKVLEVVDSDRRFSHPP
ncbi:hypothetical protein Godav_003791 [Gossypium davidsonii]|uniref:RNase H type-1 domain-containing protein n=2 Tax=Gossypium TaxID=3633 RepID=A0A7J8SJ15_GOSDV|nr:hypothetical protein [Gossypium davidsonii]MBA0661648.1 hypothetical protein [Gossypium klotzschianum]